MNKIVLIFSLVLFIGFISTFVLADSISVIVNTENNVSSLSVSEVRTYYLREEYNWSSGESINLVDRNEGSPPRNIFLRKVLNQSASENLGYWIQRKHTNGRVAPLQVNSDSMVIGYVRKMKGALGYVMSDSLMGEQGVKVVCIVEE